MEFLKKYKYDVMIALCLLVAAGITVFLIVTADEDKNLMDPPELRFVNVVVKDESKDGDYHLRVENVDNEDSYVKMSIKVLEGSLEDFNTIYNGWEYRDGFYYYPKILKPGDVTSDIIILDSGTANVSVDIVAITSKVDVGYGVFMDGVDNMWAFYDKKVKSDN